MYIKITVEIENQYKLTKGKRYEVLDIEDDIEDGKLYYIENDEERLVKVPECMLKVEKEEEQYMKEASRVDEYNSFIQEENKDKVKAIIGLILKFEKEKTELLKNNIKLSKNIIKNKDAIRDYISVLSPEDADDFYETYKQYLDYIDVEDILKKKDCQKRLFGNQKGKIELKIR